MGSEQPTRPRIRLIAYGLIACFSAALIASLEIAGWCYLRAEGVDTDRLFWARGGIQEAAGLFDTRDSFASLDPLLSHAHNRQKLEELGLRHLPGFVIYGEADNEHALTVVALGGSTTDPLVEENWPRMLANQFAAAGIPARVYNGGVAGYSSSQELLKLLRDVLPLDPDLVISLNGVNDIGYLHAVPDHPMIHPYQRRVLASLAGDRPLSIPLLPNAVRAALRLAGGNAAPGMNWGTPVDAPPHDQWLRNVRAMHAAAGEFGVPYLCVLQPILGFGHYEASPEERAMLDETAAQHAPRRDYIADMQAFYRNASEAAGAYPFIMDLTGVFAGKSGMYRDSRHQTPAGVRVLAEAIYAHLEARNLTGNRPATPGNP
ncbi:MAG: SGNH/GDSL hydrolase family protein [Candidatus Hydrogenedentes bacterium]|nr:SGNH/GDSL hydrolase family protein [Candidatus Hydrogenedentota bacterium]